jgi:hypothetical protein
LLSQYSTNKQSRAEQVELRAEKSAFVFLTVAAAAAAAARYSYQVAHTQRSQAN